MVLQLLYTAWVAARVECVDLSSMVIGCFATVSLYVVAMGK